MSLFGEADSLDAARDAAEDAAQSYVEDLQKSQLYLFDTDSHERIGYKGD